jgi:hypothetical protein
MGSQVHLEADGLLNLEDNNVKFNPKPVIEYLMYDLQAVCCKNFEKLSLHLSLKCENKNCNNNYFIASSHIKCANKYIGQDNKAYFNLAPIDLYMESFTVEDVWVQNLWSENITCLYSVENFDNPPIEVPLIDWNEVDELKIKNKIKTLIVLS